MDFHGTDNNDTIDQAKQGIPNGSAIYGGKGDDTIIFTGGNALGEAGNDTITATASWNTVAYWNSPAAVKVNLTTGLALDGFGGTDRLVNVHSVADSAYDDELTGSAGNDTFWLSWGSNRVVGSGGADAVNLYNTRSTQVTITYNAPTDTFTIVKNLASGDKGTNTLTGVSAIAFLGPESDNVTVTRDMFDRSAGFLRDRSYIAAADMNKIQQLRTGDFNGDGKLDILVSRAELDWGATKQPLQVLIGDGAGNFSDQTTKLFKDGVPYVNFVPRIFAADFNNDGITDIFNPDFGMDAPPFPGGQNSLYLSNKATGLFTNETASLPQALRQNHGTSIGDINHDGYLDLFVNALNDHTGHANDLLVNDGTGHFVSSPQLLPAYLKPVGFDPGNTWSMMKDLNNDGYADLVLGAWDNGVHPTQLFLNDGKGSFANAKPIDLPRSAVPNEIVIGIETIDLNGDALPDLVLSVTNGGAREGFYQAPYIQLMVNQGDGKFADETALRFPQAVTMSGYWYKSATPVDMNMDGFQDLVLDADATGVAKILMNDGHGKFSVGWTSAAGHHIVAADVDADGMPDIVETSSAGYSVLHNTFARSIGASHVYRASDRGDIVNGTAAGETIYSGAGTDTFDGGAGLDTVVFGGKRADFAIAKSGADYAVTGGGVKDLLVNVERITFGDSHVALDVNGTAGQAYRIYQAAFNRTPDNSGLGYWISVMDKGLTLTDVASGFVKSDEFKTMYGAAPTNRELVSKIYLNVLHRQGETAGVDYWTGLLDTKASTLPEVLAGFSESSENKIALIGTIENGIVFTPFG